MEKIQIEAKEMALFFQQEARDKKIDSCKVFS